MDINQKGIITLIKSALTDEKYTLEDAFDLEIALELAKKHQIIPILYYGALNCGFDANSQVMQNLFSLTCQYVFRSTNQSYAIEKLFNAFEQSNIEYLPLKGTNLRNLYPKVEMRVMSDADILIKFEQYEKIKPIMLEQGYSEGAATSHELKWYSRNFLIELHRLLIPAYSKDYSEYFGNGWRLAKKVNGQSRYCMSPEDELIYIFTHFAKHYRDTGVGIKHIVDIWVYRNTYKTLDESYIKKELQKLSLYGFYVNVLKTLDCWFNDVEFDEKSEFISDIIFNSGVFGTHEAMLLSRAVRMSKSTGKTDNVKLRKFINLVFPRYKDMCIRYSFLSKVPLLLPVMWVVRLVDAVLFRRKTIESKNNDLKAINKEKIDDYQQSLKFVDLDFNFVEDEIL